MSAAPRRAYDHRLREMVCESGNLRLATKIGVPKATAASWRRRGCREVLTLDSGDKEVAELRKKMRRLEGRVDALLAIVRLLLVLVRLRGARLDGERLPEGAAKEQVLRAIKRATGVLKLDTALRVVGLSQSRFHAWRQAGRLCHLNDRSSCPKTTPFQLSAAEVSTIHEMVLDDDYRHIPVSGLAILAQRMGRVFASPTTWGKLIKERGWRRPRERVHPKSPSEGIRATRPNEYWHIDVTVIRLLTPFREVGSGGSS